MGDEADHRPPSRDVGPPGEWGGRPRVAVLVTLAAATIAAFVVVIADRGSSRAAPAVVARRPASTSPAPRPSTAPPITTAAAQAALQTSTVTHLIARGSRVYCGEAHSGEVALTFDDGPGPETAPILRLLTAARVPATFFVIGRNVAARPDLVRREVALGMAVGDHTETHPDLTELSASQVHDQLLDARDQIEAATGVAPLLFRPPYGDRNAHVDAVARALGLLEVLWDVDTRDSERAPPAAIAANAQRGMRGGSIILMHEDPTTVQALPAILRAVRARHLTPVTVPALVLDGHRTRTCPYIPATE